MGDNNVLNKQRVLMHGHQGRNVRHGLCHIYMKYVYIYELFIAFVCFVVCSLLSGVPDYFYRNKISSGGDLSHYSSASLYQSFLLFCLICVY